MRKFLFASQLRINMVSGMASTAINILITVCGYPIYLHYLGYEKYGIWLILATILSFTQLSNMGIGPAVMKLVAEHHSKGDHDSVSGYVSTAICTLIISGLVALLFILLFKTQIIGLFKVSGTNLAEAICLLPFMGVLSIYIFIVQVFSATLSGLGRMDISNYFDTLGRLIALGLSTLMLHFGWGLNSMLIGSFASFLFINGTVSFATHRFTGYRVLRICSIKYKYLKRLLTIGFGVFGGSLISMLLGPFNKVMISRYIGVQAIPLYEIAFNGAMQLRSLIEAGFRALSPDISKISANIGMDSLNKILTINKRSLRLIWCLGAPFYLTVLVFLNPALKIWLGTRFHESLPLIFRVMLIGSFCSLLGVPSFYILLGLGKTFNIFIGNVLQSITNAVLILACVIIGFPISLNYFVIAVMTGMIVAHLYLVFQKRNLLRGMCNG